MASGGYRPGAGRKVGAKDSKPRKVAKRKPAPTEQEKIRQMLSFGTRAKAKMYQEFLQRISQGGTLTTAEKKLMDKIGTELEAEVKVEVPERCDPKDLEASEFLRQTWKDPNVEISLRIRAAEIAFRGSDEKRGKKDERADRAKAAGAGKFAPSAPPALKVVK
jgi:hypothetical protein